MKKIAVLGDLILDVFIYGTCDRLNPEGPYPLVSHQKEIKKFGGAGNLVENFKSLGLSVDFYSANTPPSKKTRIIADGVAVCRFDQDVQSPKIDLSAISTEEYEHIVISDYNKGAIPDCSDFIKQTKAKVFVDPKKSFENYRGAFCIKPNKQEFIQFYNKYPTPENVAEFARSNDHELVIVTLGKDGLIYYYDGKTKQLPSFANEVIDVTGAGDSFMAALVYCFSKGMSVYESVFRANLGAKVSVEKTGTHSLTQQELMVKKVFTNGCFDIIHPGHIQLLKKSKELGDYLVVGLNSDASVKRLKGESRPVNDQKTRKRNIEQLNIVDEVLIFDEDTPYELIRSVKPDLITKGGDYTPELVVGFDVAPVHIIPYLEGYSTSSIIKNEKLRNG